MTTGVTNLYRVDELEDDGRTSGLAGRDLAALHAVAHWIRSYVIKPHPDLGRDGPVCPYVPGALEREKLWLAPEHADGRDVSDVATLMTDYRRSFLELQPGGTEDDGGAAIIVVFTDLSPSVAQGLFADVLQQIAVPAYVEDGIVYGPFYEGHQGTAIYNSSFHPFRSPVPFMFVRHGVVNDWKFFIDDENWFDRFAHRFRESAVRALGAELRRFPWRVPA